MIVFELVCSNGHRFETWFPNSAAYDTQSATGKIACPFCADNRIAKAPMAPHVARSAAKTRPHGEKAEDAASGMARAVKELKRYVKENCDYVAGDFPEEARRIHYGESERRGIYGEASDKDASALKDEGIEVRRIPWFSRQDD